MLPNSKIATLPIQEAIIARLKDYGILVKLRLNLTVVFSSVIGYLLAMGTNFTFFNLFMLGLGGFLITGSANALNQILEKDYDKLMKRTKNRPLAANRMSITEAVLLAGLLGIIGIGLLWYFFNEMAALTGAISLLLYAFVYTPLKRINPIAVFVGAIPGALPPVIGWLAATSVWGYEAFVLFAIQFLWQFPHFWAIGWLGAEEYANAGYKLMPTPETKNRYTALQVVLYILCLIMITCVPSLLGLVSYYFIGVALVCGLGFLYTGIQLVKKCDDKAALMVMFASIIYLPILQISMVFDRIFLVVN